jgi:hypothetical protein
MDDPVSGEARRRLTRAREQAGSLFYRRNAKKKSGKILAGLPLAFEV